MKRGAKRPLHSHDPALACQCHSITHTYRDLKNILDSPSKKTATSYDAMGRSDSEGHPVKNVAKYLLFEKLSTTSLRF